APPFRYRTEVSLAKMKLSIVPLSISLFFVSVAYALPERRTFISGPISAPCRHSIFDLQSLLNTRLTRHANPAGSSTVRVGL
ncbi:hypothetical protein CPB84DRAFT_1785409, partial [Gymnopilus junonius]